MSYVFAKDQIGLDRAKMLHSVFAGSSESFLSEFGEKGKNLILDLGCGPGYTTRTVSKTLAPKMIIGLDNSDSFIEQAKIFSKDIQGIEFQTHDITHIPFPVTQADGIYFRFVLTHMQDKFGSLFNWSTQLKTKGMILLEETESIHTENPAFIKYMDIADNLLKSNNNQLYIGKQLNAQNYSPHFTKKTSRISRVGATSSKAADLFQYNILAWREQKFVQDNYSNQELDDLENEIQQLRNSKDSAIVIEWSIRQMVLIKSNST